MPDMNQKIDRFTASILEEAAAENERKEAQLQKKRKDMLTAAEDAILLDSYNFIHGEVGRIHTEAGKRVSQRALEQKRALATRRNEITREVLDTVKARLAQFTTTADYAGRLDSLLQNALKVLGNASQLRVFLRAEDMSHQAHLTAAAPGVSLIFSQGAFRLGGLVAAAPTLGLRVDSTFDGMLDTLEGEFAELFGQSLSEQS